tara:strand:- start:2270 stop:2866 length:597 start_codon:yes stop_codon:yes gene_type:complete
MSEEENQPENDELVAALNTAFPVDNFRATGLYGDVTEERCAETIYSLLSLKSTLTQCSDEPDPIEFYISTYGGQASEMFSLYDLMRLVQSEVPIHTYGIGKVMSAGVLLLAAGTKGERRIGANCRVMIHGLIAGQHGQIPDIENEFTEVKMTQKLYIKSLARETNMDEKQIKKMMDKKTNVYLDAEKVIELGIADIIF